MKIIVEVGTTQPVQTSVTVSDLTAQHIHELRPIMASALKLQTVTLADVVLMLVEAQTHKEPSL